MIQPRMIGAAVLTISDGVAAGERQDISGDLLAGLLQADGFEVVQRRIVADDRRLIAAGLTELCGQARLVVTTGGTGLGPRDVTPEATRDVIDREAPGIAQLMMAAGLAATPLASLSRAVVGTLGEALVVNLPGNPRAVEEALAAIAPVLRHALDLIAGDTAHGPQTQGSSQRYR
ncbi:MAG: MogA/MoaB family molybdenum cofactor biosynthesis protein [Actinomycetota bacterium]